MTNILDYIAWRGDLTFTQDPPNQVDMLIFSSLAYVRYNSFVSEAEEPILLREAEDHFESVEILADKGREENDRKLLRDAAASTRFGLTKLWQTQDEFVPQENTQFAAVTFLLDDGSMVLAFRGTDDSLVGWKEDLSMSFQQAIPSQILAQNYVHSVWSAHNAPMRLCGHSKGGNLAVFAAARSSPMIQQWIQGVYSNDGPGFSDYLMGDPGYLAMVPKIRTFVPQSSIIGMVLEHEEPYTIIHSNQVSILQHDLFSWEVVGKEFVPMEEITADSRFLNQTIRNWLDSMDLEARNQMVEALFGLLSTGEVSHVSDIFHPRNLRNYAKALGDDDVTRNILSGEFQSLLDAAKKARQEMSEKVFRTRSIARKADREEPELPDKNTED